MNVVVTIIGTQRDKQGEESRIELITAGRGYEKNGVRYIVYQESEISGLEGVTTMLKLYDNQVVLVRTGSIDHKQEFCPGQKRHSMYITPYGTMQMSILTQNLQIALNGIAGSLEVSYELEMNGQWQSTNTLSISIQEEM